MPSALHPSLRHRWAGFGPAGGVSQTPPLPSTALEYWHGELGASAANAVGQIAAMTLPGVNTPIVAVDTGFFNERTVYQSAVSGSRCWYANPGTITTAGTRPYVYALGRFRTVPSGARADLVGLGEHFSGDRLAFMGTAAASRRAVFGRTSFAQELANGTVDTAVHRLEAWQDGTNRHFRVDGVDATAVDADTIRLGNSVGIGCASAAGAANVSDGSVAFFLICTAKPSDAEITALNEWATAYWGAP